MKKKFTVRQSLNYIDEHLDENISLEKLAEQARLSKYHFHRLFRQTVGEPVSQYIRKRRMAGAAKDLAETDRPIMEIALNCQYASQEAFSRAFQRIYALTPGKYRRLFASGGSKVVRFSVHTRRIRDLAA